MSKLTVIVLLASLLGLALAIPWVPEPRADEDWWLERHDEYVNNSKINGNGTNVVFYGDSITQNWAGDGSETYNQYYEPLGTANYGIGSDRAEHVLWRIINGEVDGLNVTKVCVLKIGTNNLEGNSDEEIARGIASITDALRSRQPHLRVLVLGILPRSNAALTARVDNVNRMISILDNGNTIRFFNLRDSFYLGNGVFKTELYTSDLLHLSAAGYAEWARAMDPLLKEMLRQ